MKKIVKFSFYALLLLVIVLLYNTFTFNSKQISVEPGEPINLPENIEKRLAESIRIPTVSYYDRIDTAAFVQLNHFLDSQFLLVDTMLEKTMINEYSRIYRWQGRKQHLKPILLIAHLDVVPVEGESLKKWTEPPFSGKIKDGILWGRGSLDDKVSAIGILEAADFLLKSDYQPERTLYFAFGHDEEVGGKQGALAISKYFEKNNISFEYVLDEGMVLIEGALPGVKAPTALIGLAEKGYVTLKVTANTTGGHSSMPPKNTAVGILGKAIAELEANPLPASLDGPTSQLFDYAGPEMSFPLKVVMANRWLFDAVLIHILSGKHTTNATVRTTTAATMINGGVKDNVLPTTAAAKVNFRIRPGETMEDVESMVKAIIDDERVTVERMPHGRNPSGTSSTENFGFQVLQRTSKETFPQALVAPALVLAGTDSRFYESIAQDVYRFLPVYFRKGDTDRIHGIDERINVKDYEKAVEFYIRLIQNSTN